MLGWEVGFPMGPPMLRNVCTVGIKASTKWHIYSVRPTIKCFWPLAREEICSATLQFQHIYNWNGQFFYTWVISIWFQNLGIPMIQDALVSSGGFRPFLGGLQPPLSNDTNIIFVLQIEPEICPNQYRSRSRPDWACCLILSHTWFLFPSQPGLDWEQNSTGPTTDGGEGGGVARTIVTHPKPTTDGGGVRDRNTPRTYDRGGRRRRGSADIEALFGVPHSWWLCEQGLKPESTECWPAPLPLHHQDAS